MYDYLFVLNSDCGSERNWKDKSFSYPVWDLVSNKRYDCGSEINVRDATTSVLLLACLPLGASRLPTQPHPQEHPQEHSQEYPQEHP